MVSIALVAVYLAVASPWINVLDGEDYANRANLHLKLYSELTSKVDQINDGAVVLHGGGCRAEKVREAHGFQPPVME